MRINQYVARATGISRREVDVAIAQGSITINGQPAKIGQQVNDDDVVMLNDTRLSLEPHKTILLNKPVGYVCSRDGQGAPTIYDLLPPELHKLKPVGRLDKDSSGLLLMTTDGHMAQDLTHPSKQKQKMYEVELDKPLKTEHWYQLIGNGVELEDGNSSFDQLRWVEKNNKHKWVVYMHEGRNRQIRRTFAALGYNVVNLHRTQFGDYGNFDIESGSFLDVSYPVKN